MVVHVYIHSTRKAEVTGSLIEGQFRLHCETLSQNSSIHSRKILFVGKTVQKPYMLVKIYLGAVTVKNSTEVSKEIKHTITIRYPSEYIPKEIKSLLHKHICTFISLYHCSQRSSMDVGVKKLEQTRWRRREGERVKGEGGE